jgi:Zn-dependent protease
MQSLHPAQEIVIWALPVLFAITVHEVAHGWVANQLGDPTARMLGRLTLNPIKHIDPVGTVLVPALLMLFGGFLFGWAKPVPVTPGNLRAHRYGMAWVAVAGPVSNLLQAVVWAVVIKLAVGAEAELGWMAELLYLMGLAGVSINLSLAVLNLLPVPPLDGGRIVDALLPGPLSAKYSQLEPWGLWIVLGLIATKLLGVILAPPYYALRAAIGSLVGLEGAL